MKINRHQILIFQRRQPVTYFPTFLNQALSSLDHGDTHAHARERVCIHRSVFAWEWGIYTQLLGVLIYMWLQRSNSSSWTVFARFTPSLMDLSYLLIKLCIDH